MNKYCQIIVSENFEQFNTPNQVIHKVVQPVMMLRAPFLPSALSFFATIVTVGFANEKEIVFEFSIKNPNGDYIFQLGQQRINQGYQSFDNFNFNIDCKNIPFYVAGVYIIEVILNGDVHTHNLIIDKIKQN